MQIKKPRFRIKQYDAIEVTCLDSIMAEMLSCSPDSHILVTVDHINSFRSIPDIQYNPSCVYKFNSGALLMVGFKSNKYYVYSMAIDGSDALSAFAELEMLDALRIAKQKFYEMKQLCRNNSLDGLSLRVTRY